VDDWAEALSGFVHAESEAFGEEIYYKDLLLKATIGSTRQTLALQAAGYLDQENLIVQLPRLELYNITEQPKVNEVIELRGYGYRISSVRNMDGLAGYEIQCELIPEYVSVTRRVPKYFTPAKPSEILSDKSPNKPEDLESDLASTKKPRNVQSELLSPIAPSEILSVQLAGLANPSDVQAECNPAAPSDIDATINDVELYLIAGQSNAHGHSPIADLTGTQTDDINIGFYTSWHNGTSDATSTQYYSDYVATMELGKTRGDANESTLDSNYFGIEWGFAKAIEAANSNNTEIGIIKYAVGASSIDDNTALSDWDLSSTTECWQGLKNTFVNSYLELLSQGKNPVWKGFLWYQGESNGGTEPYLYKQALNDLCKEIESELGITNLPAVFVAPADASGNDLYVNNAHASLAKSADFYDFIKASDYHDGTYSNVHLSAQNMYDAGVAAGNAMANAVAGTATDTEFEPSTNIDFWIDGDDASLVTEDSSTHVVTSIAAKAGNIDILPLSKDSNPVEIIHEHNAIADRDCFTMSHDREYLETDGLVTMPTATHDWFVVARPDGINNGQDAIWATEQGRAVTLIPVGGNKYVWYWNNVAVSSAQGTASLDGELSLFCIRWNFTGSHTSTWFNGTQRDSQRSIGSASNFSMVNLRFHFMAQYGATNTTDGNFCEAIVSTATADRVKIEGYLAHKWGIANKLPASHTYKYYAP
jgi:hypothetical protein